LLVRDRIEPPETIERRASPQQSSCGKTRHDGTEEQENADRNESRRLRPESEVEAGAIVVPHLLNISQSRNPSRITPLDSGLCSRLYDFVMAANHQLSTPMLQIGEVARRTALTVDAIRFYEKRRLLPKAVRTTGRFRMYTA
jgi:hypothetical protein